MLKILQINTTANSGSTGRIAAEIGLKVIEGGGESHIAYGTYANKCSSKLIKVGGKLSIFYHELLSHFFDNSGLLSVCATKKVIKEIEKVNPDIIHLHNIHGFYLNIKILFRYLAKSKRAVVWTLHDCWSFTGHCAHFSYVGCDRWKSGCYSCPNKKEYPASWFLDRSKRNYNLKKELFTSVDNLHIVTVSKWLNGLLKESFLKNIPSQVIYNGVDIDIFFPWENDNSLYEKYKINKGDKIAIAAATNWGKSKGIADYNRVSEQLPEGYKVVLVGVPEKRLKLVSEKITVIPRTENIAELAKLYSIADVVLNLSYEESFGLTSVEGMACGTPSILYRATASPELITPECGVIVEAGDIDGVVKGVIDICNRGKEHYSEACVSHVLNNFNKDDLYCDYIDLYNRYIQKKSLSLSHYKKI